MKTFQRWMGILLVAIAASGLVVACGDTSETTCLSDGDCATGNLCNFETETCAVACTDDATLCTPGEETCEARGQEPGSICVGFVPDNNDTGCTADTDCDTANGETCNLDTGICEGDTTDECVTLDDCAQGEVCLDGVCEAEAQETYFVAVVADVATTCDADATDPGADIFGVSLKKGTDQTYFADTLGSTILGDNNEHADPDSILDGNAPEFTGTCPEFTGNVVSLGCGGEVAVNFVDDSGVPVEIEDGDTITVMEWGGQCQGTGEAGDNEEWEVLLCDPAATDIILDTANCNGTSIGTNVGENSVTVTLP